ncbi:MAG: phosphoribosylanthranilate isomerase [Bacillota bacterium]
MTNIKICGLMEMKDVLAVNRHKPEYAGFVFAKSRRQVRVEAAKIMVNSLDSAVMPVGVFVDADTEAVAAAAAACRLGAVQLHGGEGQAYIDRLRKLLPAGTLVFKAVRVKDAASLTQADKLDCDLFVLDAWSEGLRGGSGETFEWELVKGFQKPFLLAGGLDCSNVQSAIERCKPYGVDVSSGVETGRRKDAGKIAAFIETVRRQSV